MTTLTAELIAQIYEDAEGELSNAEIYEKARKLAGLSAEDMQLQREFGDKKVKTSEIKHKIRWFQQTLKHAGIIEKVSGVRGVWQLARLTDKGLREPRANVCVVGFSTELGVGIFGDARQVFGSVRDEPITLCFSSPPYLLRNARAYGAGAESEAAYVEFIVRTLEPIVKNLVRGGSIVLNLTQDAFVPGRPSRSLYLERLILALADDLGLELMDRLVWVNRAKAPGPTQWACKKRVQLGVSYEPVIWLTSDAMHVRSDNRRVLVPHTEAHQKLIDAGGELRTTSYGDGAHRLKAGSFSAQTEGAIAKNTLIRGNLCPDTLFCHKVASELGIPRHGATSPTWLASFFIEFLTKPGELVVDHFSGYFKTAIAAERLGRRWIGTDKVLEWIAVASHMFRGHPGFEQTPLIDSLIDSYQK